MSTTLDAILHRGMYLVISGLPEQARIVAKSRAAIADAVAQLQGSAAGATVQSRGPSILHRVLPAERIGLLRDIVMPQIRSDLFRFVLSAARTLIGMEGEFFVSDYTILRINYPYSVAVKAPLHTENPGTGRMHPAAFEESQKHKIMSPIYDPRGFNRNEPPAAWAHGVHTDTWAGHSRLGINFWWAMDDIPEECSIVLYPEVFGKGLVRDPRSLYLREGQPLPKPANMSLRSGEVLVFNPEIPHSTHLNVGEKTRVALSARVNPHTPKFDPECFYAHEFWHSSTDLECGRLERIVRFPREENLEAAEPVLSRDVDSPTVPVLEAGPPQGEWVPVSRSHEIRAFQKAIVTLPDGSRVLIARGEDRLHAVQSRCPHLNAGLADGYHDSDQIYCPTHAVSYSLASGASACELLKLETFDVREADGFIWLRGAC